MIDERHEEAAALYALDLLEGDERVAFEVELASNPELRALIAQLRATSAQLAYAAPSASPSPFLRERVLASTRAKDRQAKRWPSQLGWGVAACLALSAGVLGWKTIRLSDEAEQLRLQVTNAQAVAQSSEQSIIERERARMQQMADALRLAQADADKLRATLDGERTQSAQIIATLRSQANVSDLKIQSLASLLGNSSKANAIAVWNPLTQEGVLTVANLPALEANRDYQLWLLEPQGNAAVDAGVFRVDPTTGEARIIFKPKTNVRSVDKFAVSLERKGGVPTREGPVVLLGQ